MTVLTIFNGVHPKSKIRYCAGTISLLIYTPFVSQTNIFKEVLYMKAAIQPKFFDAQVKCSCGNEFVTGSTKENIHVEVCSKCHPFYTGSQKLLLEAGGRVEKFKKKYNR